MLRDRPDGRRPAPATPHRALALGGLALLLLLQACAPRQEAPPTPSPTRDGTPPAATRSDPTPLDGRAIADAHEYPWSALGRVNLAGQGFCNGILIAPQLVLTQAQCLYSKREGRWWQPQELHFIAAYQRDRFLADSKIAGFTPAPGYTPAAGANLANLTNNWAVLKLAEPIGLKTGWLGLQWRDAGLEAREARGEAVTLRAGYRVDWPHAISLYFGCKGRGAGATDLCQATPSERGLPPFVLADGEMRVLADFFVRGAAQGSALARQAAMTRRGNLLGDPGQPPDRGSVRAAPTASATTLLLALGYANASRDVEAAAADYAADLGLPPRSPLDLSLLAAMIRSAQRIE
ncbi:serine protease [Pelagibius sp.]|uniref:trypsin-like serine peptidase n=1 Tax=Pelagibius sp. TaxID=1931238 RepID=UPI00260D1532|nr:trypsin-like serine protease [Pelagibius sp.]